MKESLKALTMYDVGKRVAEIKKLEADYEKTVAYHNHILQLRRTSETLATAYFEQVSRALGIMIDDVRKFVIAGMDRELIDQAAIAEKLMYEIRMRINEGGLP